MGFNKWDKHDYSKDEPVAIADRMPLVAESCDVVEPRRPITRDTDIFGHKTPKTRKYLS